MSTVNLTASSMVPSAGLDKAYLRKITVDFSANNVLASDVVQLFSIPANTLVEYVAWRVTTAEGATCTATIGDGEDPDGYKPSGTINLNSTSDKNFSGLLLTEATPNTVTAYTGGKLYSTADTIDLVMGHDTNAAKIVVFAKCIDLS